MNLVHKSIEKWNQAVSLEFSQLQNKLEEKNDEIRTYQQSIKELERTVELNLNLLSRQQLDLKSLEVSRTNQEKELRRLNSECKQLKRQLNDETIQQEKTIKELKKEKNKDIIITNLKRELEASRTECNLQQDQATRNYEYKLHQIINSNEQFIRQLEIDFKHISFINQQKFRAAIKETSQQLQYQTSLTRNAEECNNTLIKENDKLQRNIRQLRAVEQQQEKQIKILAEHIQNMKEDFICNVKKDKNKHRKDTCTNTTEIHTNNFGTQTEEISGENNMNQVLKQNEVLKNVIRNMKSTKNLSEDNRVKENFLHITEEMNKKYENIERDLQQIKDILKSEEEENNNEHVQMDNLERMIAQLKLKLFESVEHSMTDDNEVMGKEWKWQEIKMALFEHKVNTGLQNMATILNEDKNKILQELKDVKKEIQESLHHNNSNEEDTRVREIRYEITRLEDKIEKEIKLVKREQKQVKVMQPVTELPVIQQYHTRQNDIKIYNNLKKGSKDKP